LVGYGLFVTRSSLLLGWILATSFFGDGPMTTITTIIFSGGMLAAGVAMVEKLFIIRNPTVGMFVTQDSIASLLGREGVNVLYGPGVHISYPWERRLKGNNISLTEAPNEIKFPVQCKDGMIYVEGSYRMSPDLKNPVAFLKGVATVADEIKDIIIADVVAYLKGKTVMDAVNDLQGINERLRRFQTEHTDVEKRFGIHIGDVTISRLLPSDDVQRTISGITEAKMVQIGTELLLGIPEGKLSEWQQDGRVSGADIKEARDRFLSVSGNLEGMDIKRHEFDVSIHGLDPEVAKAIVELARSPIAQAFLSKGAAKVGKTAAKKPQPKTGGNSK